MSSPANQKRIRTTALIVATSLFMEQLDSTVLATALPTMADSFHVSAMHMSIGLTSYMLSLAVFLPASGWIADRFGARPVFCSAIAIFTLGSMLCGQAESLYFLVAARLLQGMGGAMMVPVGRLLLLRSIPREEMISAMAWFLVPAMIGPLIGPPLGGLIVTHLSWQWIFYLNIPIGLIGLVLVLIYIEDVRETRAEPFDWRGLVISGTSLSCLIFGLELISRGALELPSALAVLGIGLSSAALYFWHAKHSSAPILDLTMMRVDSFKWSVFGGSLTRISGGATPFLLPLMMQLGFGMSAERSGLITFASAAGAVAMKASATPILRRFGYRRTLMWNGLLASSMVALIAAFTPSWPIPLIYAVLLICGFFQSLQFTAYNTLAYAEIEKPRMSAAIAFYSTMQQMMLSIGICVGALSLNAALAFHGEQEPSLIDFSFAFLCVASLSMLASPICAQLSRNAGDDLAGRGSKVQHSGMR